MTPMSASQIDEDISQCYKSQPKDVILLVTSTAAASPYLQHLLIQEADWLNSVWQMDSDQVMADLLCDEMFVKIEEVSQKLRIKKHRIALYIALADLSGAWQLQDVTHALSDFADYATNYAIKFLLLAEFNRGKLPGMHQEDLSNSLGYFVIAMGKLGARELNYSSDIDLIVMFDGTKCLPENYADIRATFIKVTQKVVQILSKITKDGYVFRTDLRLRPDPSVTPVCISVDAALHYYEALGRTWERAAFIKARVSAGDIQAGNGFLQQMEPFIYRKHLDFAAIEDAHDIRLRIREKLHTKTQIELNGHNLKLGRGGIREIEFFTQTKQLIAGGRDDSLRVLGTLDALNALVISGWVKQEDANQLSRIYTKLRNLEHRVQMMNDTQTHLLPDRDDKWKAYLALCGVKDENIFKQDILNDLNWVDQLCTKFYDAGACEDEVDTHNLSKDDLEIIDNWSNYPFLRSDRAAALFNSIKPIIIKRLSDSSSSRKGLLRLDSFLSKQLSGVQLLSLFTKNRQILDLVLDICMTSERLSEYLGSNPNIIEHVLTPDFYQPLPNLPVLKSEISSLLASYFDYEDQLDCVRKWTKELRFKIGVQFLRSITNIDEVEISYSNVAEAALSQLHPCVVLEFSKRFGPPIGGQSLVIAMGKLGSREMTMSSDLDLMMLYVADTHAMSLGKKPLPASTYYVKQTQKIITSITAKTANGALYPVDMRLRPSGNKGPMASHMDGFTSYQMKEAWSWEHLALTRARPVAGNEYLFAKFMALKADILKMAGANPKLRQNTVEMRERLANASPSKGVFDVKRGLGGLLDVELVLQLGMVINQLTDIYAPQHAIPILVDKKWLSQRQGELFVSTLHLYKIIQHVTRLATTPWPDAKDVDHLWLLELTGYPNLNSLSKKIASVRQICQDEITVLLSS